MGGLKLKIGGELGRGVTKISVKGTLSKKLLKTKTFEKCFKYFNKICIKFKNFFQNFFQNKFLVKFKEIFKNLKNFIYFKLFCENVKHLE